MTLPTILLISAGLIIGCIVLYSAYLAVYEALTKPTENPPAPVDRDSWTDETCLRCVVHYNPSVQSATCPHSIPIPLYAIGDTLEDRRGIRHCGVRDYRIHKGEIMYEFVLPPPLGPYWLKEEFFCGRVTEDGRLERKVTA